MRSSLIGLLSILVWSGSASALKFEGVEMADSQVVGGKTLVLNGKALRKVRRFGMNFKVYVGGLYLTEKSSDGAKIIASPEPKVFEFTFLRTVGAGDLEESYSNGFKGACGECEAYQEQIKKLLGVMTKMKEGHRITIVFLPESGTYSIGDKDRKTVQLDGKAFRDLFLSMYVGPNPVTPDVKPGLLGL